MQQPFVNQTLIGLKPPNYYTYEFNPRYISHRKALRCSLSSSKTVIPNPNFGVIYICWYIPSTYQPPIPSLPLPLSCFLIHLVPRERDLHPAQELQKLMTPAFEPDPIPIL